MTGACFSEGVQGTAVRAHGRSTSLMTAQKLRADGLWRMALVKALPGRVSAKGRFLFTTLKRLTGVSADGRVPSLLLTSLAKAVVEWQNPVSISDPKPLRGLSWCFIPPCAFSEPCTLQKTKIWGFQ